MLAKRRRGRPRRIEHLAAAMERQRVAHRDKGLVPARWKDGSIAQVQPGTEPSRASIVRLVAAMAGELPESLLRQVKRDRSKKKNSVTLAANDMSAQTETREASERKNPIRKHRQRRKTSRHLA